MEKKVKNKLYKCANCGGNLKYSPKHSALYCGHCLSIEPIEDKGTYLKHDYKDNLEDTSKYKDWASTNKVCSCSNCGSMVVLNKYDVGKKCPYCGCDFVTDTSELPTFQPDAVLPFQIEKEDVAIYYKKGVKRKWFLPNAFKKNPPMDKIEGIYIPAIGFDASTKSTYSGVLVHRHSQTDRNGKAHTYETTENISGKYDEVFSDVLVESSQHINQVDFDGLKPYNLSQSRFYDDAYLLGYATEYYSNQMSDLKKISEKIINNSIKNSILRQYSYDDVRSFVLKTHYENEKYCYHLLPTYKVEYIYKGKKYISYINGQSGKVSGRVPRSVVKILFFILGIAILLLIPALVYYFYY